MKHMASFGVVASVWVSIGCGGASTAVESSPDGGDATSDSADAPAKVDPMDAADVVDTVESGVADAPTDCTPDSCAPGQACVL